MKNFPFNTLAERSILSIALSKSDLASIICQNLNLDCFYLEKHRLIYKAIFYLNKKNKPIDLLTVSTWLQDNQLLNKIGGIEFLTELINDSILSIDLNEYLGLLQDKYLRRSLINLGYQIIEAGYQTNKPLENLLKQIEYQIFNLNQKNFSESLSSSVEIFSNILDDIKLRSKNKTSPGLTTLFYDLDALTQGFQNSDLIIIAGRPSMGKTAFCLNLARNIALRYSNKTIILFSLEMSKTQLGYRLLSSETGIELTRLKSGRISSSEWEKINKAIQKLSKLPFYIDDNPSPSLVEIRLKIRELIIDNYDIGLLIIDYLQLLESSKKKNNRVQELSEITRILKNIAREFNIPVIVLSQLSRSVETRINKRPILSDLRESGCISKNQKFWTYQSKLIGLVNKNLKLKNKFKFRITGKKPCYKLITNDNRSLILTSKHKILTKMGWKSLKNITKIDQVKILFPNEFKLQIYENFKSIKQINYLGLKIVYDLENHPSQNFICNGLIAHNSIEQDADVVIMLYRDDYYNNNTSEINIIELQIAKHRNGPLGMVKLYFEPRFNRFYNLSAMST